MNVYELRCEFERRYGRAPTRVFRAPGRVNLIGEHTDYNQGLVLPMGIALETLVAVAPRADRLVEVGSLNRHGRWRFDLEAEPSARSTDLRWTLYVEGMARVLDQRANRLERGADLLIHSTVPEGAGLSSSAALEIAVGAALLWAADRKLPERELARAGQEAEHRYVGTRCGLMDQLAAVFARRGHALLIDCRTLKIEPVAWPQDVPFHLAVCNSKVKHELAASAYNRRRAECERGVEILRSVSDGLIVSPHEAVSEPSQGEWNAAVSKGRIASLRDIEPDEWPRYEPLLPEPIKRRCRHVVHENARVRAFVAAMRTADVQSMGRLLLASHASLRDDYEVSCPEMDLLVEAAMQTGVVLGARMMGGGFGGSTINLVHRNAHEQFKKEVTEKYQKAFGTVPEIYFVESADGVSEKS